MMLLDLVRAIIALEAQLNEGAGPVAVHVSPQDLEAIQGQLVAGGRLAADHVLDHPLESNPNINPGEVELRAIGSGELATPPPPPPRPRFVRPTGGDQVGLFLEEDYIAEE